MKIKILVIFLLVQTLLFSQESWRAMGPDDFNQPSYDQADYPSIAIDGNNVTYIVFNDYNLNTSPLGGAKVSVRRFINGVWENVGAPYISTNTVISTSIAIDENNIPYIAYTHYGGACFVKKFVGDTWVSVGTLGSVFSAKILFDSQNDLHLVGSFGIGPAGMRKFNGTAWINVGTANISTGGSEFISADFDSNDIPYIAYSNISDGGKLTVKKLNGTIWENVGDVAVSTHDAEYVSLKLDDNNVPFVAYKHNDYFSLRQAIVQKYNGVSWEPVGSVNGAVSDSEVHSVSLEIDNNNTPVIAYFQGNGQSCHVKQFNSNEWLSIGQSFLFARNAVLIFDSTNNPLVGFSGDVAGVKRYNGTSWMAVGEESITGYSSTEYFYMTISDDDTPYIMINAPLSNTENRFYKYNGLAWEAEEGLIGLPNSTPISITTHNNVPYVLLVTQNQTNNKLGVRKFENNNWVNVGASQFTVNGENANASSMVIDNNGIIYVASKTYTSGSYYPSLRMWKNAGSGWVMMNFYLEIATSSHIDFAVGNDNRPVVVYTDLASGELMVRKLNIAGTSWEIMGSVIPTPTQPYYSRIEVDSQNVPYISYIRYDGSYMVSVYKFINENWVVVGNQFSVQYIENLNLSIDKNDIPHLIYYDGTANGRITARKLQDDSWIIVGTQGFSASRSNQLAAPVLAFNSNNVPIAAYSCFGLFTKYFGGENALSSSTLDFVNLEGPASMTLSEGQTGNVSAQVFEPGITEASGAGDGVAGWIGISPDNTHPSTWTTWVPATFNAQIDNNDEYVATIGVGLSAGTYYYASRFQLNNGTYAYGGYSSSGGGIWNETTNISGVLTLSGCETAAPNAVSAQTFCNTATVSQLEATGTGIIWYSSATGGAPLSETTVLTNNTIYYATQVINGCESVIRTPVTVTINTVVAPTGNATQEFTVASTTLSDIQIEVDNGATANWYANEADALAGVNELEISTVVTNNTTYYVTQTVNNCNSVPFAVTVSITLYSNNFTQDLFVYYPNPAKDVVHVSYVSDISSIEVYTIIGQLVLVKEVNENAATIDVSRLAQGTYIFKVASGDYYKSFKVMKQ